MVSHSEQFTELQSIYRQSFSADERKRLQPELLNGTQEEHALSEALAPRGLEIWGHAPEGAEQPEVDRGKVAQPEAVPDRPEGPSHVREDVEP